MFGAFGVIAFASPEITTSDDEKTVTVQDAPNETVIVFAKNVEIKKRAKDVVVVGGDVRIEGEVSGDVATFGGNIIQQSGGRIGGDVLVFGGSYKSENVEPNRGSGKQTLVIGVFEDQFRDFAQNPSQIFSPTFTWAFLAQRLLLALFWFVISIVLTTVAPGAVGRAVARVKLSSLKVCGLGSLGFLVTMAAIILSLGTLPDFLSVTFGLMGIALLLFGYVFGRVALQVSAGKWIQKHLLSESNQSETLSTLLGVLVWTVFLSLPYIWILALFTVFAVGIGLIFTARTSSRWRTA